MPARASVFDHQNFRHDGNGDLFRRFAADIQADGRVDGVQLFGGNAPRDELFNQPTDFALAADHAEVGKIRREDRRKTAVIRFIIGRNDHIARTGFQIVFDMIDMIDKM